MKKPTLPSEPTKPSEPQEFVWEYSVRPLSVSYDDISISGYDDDKTCEVQAETLRKCVLLMQEIELELGVDNVKYMSAEFEQMSCLVTFRQKLPNAKFAIQLIEHKHALSLYEAKYKNYLNLMSTYEIEIKKFNEWFAENEYQNLTKRLKALKQERDKKNNG